MFEWIRIKGDPHAPDAEQIITVHAWHALLGRLKELETQVKYMQNKERAEKLIQEWQSYNSNSYFQATYRSDGQIVIQPWDSWCEEYGFSEPEASTTYTLDEFKVQVLDPLIADYHRNACVRTSKKKKRSK